MRHSWTSQAQRRETLENALLGDGEAAHLNPHLWTGQLKFGSFTNILLGDGMAAVSDET